MTRKVFKRYEVLAIFFFVEMLMEVRSFLNGDEDFFFPGEVDCFLEGDPALVAVPTTAATRAARGKKGMMMSSKVEL